MPRPDPARSAHTANPSGETLEGQSDEALQSLKLQREIEKLTAETATLNRQRSPGNRRLEALRVVAGLAGLITALAGIVGLWSSLSRAQDEARRSVEARENARLQAAFENVSSATVAKQLAGIAGLRVSLVGQDARLQRQVLSVLGSMLAVEDQPIVRHAIIAMFRDLPVRQPDTVVLGAVLAELAYASRALSEQGTLHQRRFVLRRSSPDTAELRREATVARARAVGDAMLLLLRRGARPANLQAIYCESCDFSDLDLRGARFDDAALYASDFSRATLVRASFNGADLEDVRFVSADLRQSALTVRGEVRPGEPRRSYIARKFALASDAQIDAFAPNFACADLRGADFEGQPLFAFISTNAPLLTSGARSFEGYSASFAGSRASDADLRKAVFFGARDRSDGRPLAGPENAWYRRNGRELLFTLQPDSGTVSASTDRTLYLGSLSQVRAAFSASDWRTARLPGELWTAFHAEPPPMVASAAASERCAHRNP